MTSIKQSDESNVKHMINEPLDIVSHLTALCLTLFFVPFHFNLFGVRLGLSDLISLFAFGLILVALIDGKGRYIWHKNMLFILVFSVYILINGLVTEASPKYYLIESTQWLAIISLLSLMYGYKSFDTPKSMHLFITYLGVVCIFVAIWHFMQGYQSGFKLLGVSKYAFGLWCTLLYLYRKEIPYSLILIAIAITLLALSQERKAMLAFLFVVIADRTITSPLTRNSPQRYSLIFLYMLAAIFAMIGSVLTFDYIGFDRLFDYFEFTQSDIAFADQSEARWVSNLHRKLLLANGFDILSQHPVWGVGAKMLPHYMIPYFSFPELAIYTHNFLLDTTIEYGILGLFILLGGYLSFIAKCLKSINLNSTSVLLALYALCMVFFVAVNTTIILIILLPVILSNVNNSLMRMELRPITSKKDCHK